MSNRSLKPLQWYRETYIRDNYLCVYCGRDLSSKFYDWMSIEVDHIIPRSKGGGDDLDNRVTSCNVCNRLKGGFLPINYQELSRTELLFEIGQYILNKRDEQIERYKQALIEFRGVVNQQDD